MIQRTPEPELMNEPQQVKAYAAADFASTDQALVERLDQLLRDADRWPAHGDCLIDLGCGPGNISERLARRWPRCTVVGVDAAEQMILEAEDRRRQAAARQERCAASRQAEDPVPGLRQ